MSRSLWFVAGAGAGIYAAVRARRAAEILTVDGLRDRVGAAFVGARIFREEVAQGKADAEARLREQVHDSLQRAADTDPGPPPRHRADPLAAPEPPGPPPPPRSARTTPRET